jgi:hypothetical protein
VESEPGKGTSFFFTLPSGGPSHESAPDSRAAAAS